VAALQCCSGAALQRCSPAAEPCSPAALALQACSPAALQRWLCSSAALQPCRPAAVQPCSPAALQPCSPAAQQPCNPAALQPCSACPAALALQRLPCSLQPCSLQPCSLQPCSSLLPSPFFVPPLPLAAGIAAGRPGAPCNRQPGAGCIAATRQCSRAICSAALARGRSCSWALQPSLLQRCSALIASAAACNCFLGAFWAVLGRHGASGDGQLSPTQTNLGEVHSFGDCA
jgi:hypothetical protein